MRIFVIICTSLFLVACSSIPVTHQNHRAKNLYKYAHSSCLFLYMNSEGYNTNDIRSISAGIVETSNISINVFSEISIFIKNYKPNLDTKNNINIDLNKCFYLEDSKELQDIIYK